jgi:hypothetical protein
MILRAVAVRLGLAVLWVSCTAVLFLALDLYT